MGSILKKFQVNLKKTHQNGQSKDRFPILYNGILKNPFGKIRKKYSSARKNNHQGQMMTFVGIQDIRRRNSRGSSILKVCLKGPVTSICALEKQISHIFYLEKFNRAKKLTQEAYKIKKCLVECLESFSSFLTNPHFSWEPWNEHKFTLEVGAVSYFAEQTFYFLCMMNSLNYHMMMVQ
jgi:hypothetical protein